MNIQDAIDTIESVAGLTDESTPVGEAWLGVLAYLNPPHHPHTEPAELTDEELLRMAATEIGYEFTNSWFLTGRNSLDFEITPLELLNLMRAVLSLHGRPTPPATPEVVLAQRCEILAAFVAKHGFDPDQAMQIEQRQGDGTTTWRIERIPQTPADGEVA